MNSKIKTEIIDLSKYKSYLEKGEKPNFYFHSIDVTTLSKKVDGFNLFEVTADGLDDRKYLLYKGSDLVHFTKIPRGFDLHIEAQSVKTKNYQLAYHHCITDCCSEEERSYINYHFERIEKQGFTHAFKLVQNGSPLVFEGCLVNEKNN